jgi:superfamily II DNA/RNA helicase
MDIPDIARVVGFMVPSSLSVWIQRYGRVRRNSELGEAILLVEPSIYQLRKEHRKQAGPGQDDDDAEDPDNGSADTNAYSIDTRYSKKVEGSMRQWVDALAVECCRAIEKEYFGNPDDARALIVPCCDLCVLRRACECPDNLSPQEQAILKLIRHLDSRTAAQADSTRDEDVHMPEDMSDNEERPSAPQSTQTATKRPRCAGPCCAKCLKTCHDALIKWHNEIWNRDFLDCTFDPESIIPDAVLTKIASRARLKTFADIKEELLDWIWVDEYGNEALQVLVPIDAAWNEENEREKAERKAKKARVTKENQKKRYEERLAQSVRAKRALLFLISTSSVQLRAQRNSGRLRCRVSMKSSTASTRWEMSPVSSRKFWWDFVWRCHGSETDSCRGCTSE